MHTYVHSCVYKCGQFSISDVNICVHICLRLHYAIMDTYIQGCMYTSVVLKCEENTFKLQT